MNSYFFTCSSSRAICTLLYPLVKLTLTCCVYKKKEEQNDELEHMTPAGIFKES